MSGDDLRERLVALRDRIQEVDARLVELIAERRRLVTEVGEVKREAGLPVLDPGREAEVVRRAAALAREAGVDEELVRDVLWRIIASSREAQEGLEAGGKDPEEGGRGEG